MKLSEWLMGTEENGDDHCSMRVILDSDPSVIANRVAFIEKTPSVRVSDDPDVNWEQGPKGCAPEYGKYQPSRDWCDVRLQELGYEL